MNDSELVQALQQGDREAFDDLVDRYRDMVFGLCQRITGNSHDADELAHDTFVETYLKIGTLREPEKLAGWLRTIALNLARMWYRRRRHAWRELPDEVAAVEPDAEALPCWPACQPGSDNSPHRSAWSWCRTTSRACPTSRPPTSSMCRSARS